MIYDFCRRFRSHVRATKGYKVQDAAIKRTKLKIAVPGHRIPATIELIRLDTDYFKQRLHQRLQWPDDQPGAFSLSCDASQNYCKQLVSEYRRIDDKGKPEWVRISRQNHFLDCEAMNEAASMLLNVVRIPVGTVRDIGDDEPEPVRPPQGAVAQPSQIVSNARDRMAQLAERFSK